MRRNVLITGATGLVGGYFLSRIINNSGLEISLLIRPNKRISSKERLINLFKYFDMDPSFERINIYEGDLTEHKFGLSGTDYDKLNSETTDIFHSAADISFETADDRIARTNIAGTNNILNLCADNKRFYYLSTSYVCGQVTGTFSESDLDRGQTFNNEYERTKFVAENTVRDYFKTNEKNLTVLRPSIIIGEYNSGKTFQFSGFYKFMKIFYLLAKKKKETSIYLNFIPECTKNYIPIDYLTDMIEEIFRESLLWGKTYNLVNDNPVKNFEMTKFIREIFGINIHNGQKQDAFHQSIMKKTRIYMPYLRSEPDFKCDNKKKLKSSVCETIFDEEYLQRLLDYCVNTMWGRNLVFSR